MIGQQDYFEESYQEIESPISRLEDERAANILRDIEEKYNPVSTDVRIWWDLEDFVSVQLLDNELDHVHRLIQPLKNFIVFFDEARGGGAFVIPDADVFRAILENAYDFEFYITDPDYSYLIAYNRHAYLIACGTQKQRLKQVFPKPTDDTNPLWLNRVKKAANDR